MTRGAAVQTDYAGHTIPVFNPATGKEHQAQIFVAVLGASNYTFAWASLTQRLPDWIDAQARALKFFGGVPKALICDNLKAAVAKPLWFEPSLTATFEAMATHYDTTILPTRPRKPRDKAKVEGAVLIVERWILARLRNQQFFSVEALNAAIAELLIDLNTRPMRRIGRSRKDLFEDIERPALGPLPGTPFEYAEWKRAKVHPDYHIEVLYSFYSVPNRLIGRQVDVRLTYRTVEIFYSHERVAIHQRRRERGGHSTIKEHMPKAHQRYAGMTPESLITRAAGHRVPHRHSGRTPHAGSAPSRAGIPVLSRRSEFATPLWCRTPGSGLRQGARMQHAHLQIRSVHPGDRAR